MPNTPSDQASLFARKVCQGVEALKIPHEFSQSGVLTVSIGGITVIPAMDYQYAEYFQIVDDMLYSAKKSGRNTVVWSCQDKI